MESMKENILNRLRRMEEKITCDVDMHENIFEITEFEDMVRMGTDNEGNEILIWSDALQWALNRNRYVHIPSNEKVYYIDKLIIINSGNHIIADKDAVICLVKSVRTCMFRNRNVIYGCISPIDKSGMLPPDRDISIIGGTWMEQDPKDKVQVSDNIFTAFLLSNIKGLILRDMVIQDIHGFAMQIGNVTDMIVENISFPKTYGDGIHINGSVKNAAVRNISGTTGDDMIALNAWDWPGSSVNFGNIDTILIENITSLGGHKALRMLPGRKYYDDGSMCECDIKNVIIRNISGITEFKMYMQPPTYTVIPVKTAVGRADHIYLEKIELEEGACFEICSNSAFMSFEDIHLSYSTKGKSVVLVHVGPKSVTGNRNAPSDEWTEVYYPEGICKVEELYFRNITDESGDMMKQAHLAGEIQLKPNPDYPNTVPRGGTGFGIIGNIIYETEHQ